MHRGNRSRAAMLWACFLLAAGPIHAQFGIAVTEGPDPILYDISIAAVESNARHITYETQNNLGFVGMATNGAFTWGLARAYNGTGFPEHLFTIGYTNSTALAGTVGNTGQTGQLFGFGDGDCAIDSTTNMMWGMKPTGQLYTIDHLLQSAANPVATFQAAIIGLGSDLSAMAFDGSGQLFVIALANDNLYRINKTTGAVDATLPLSVDLAVGNAAMSAIPSDNANLAVVAPRFNGASVTMSLLRVNKQTGATTILGDGLPLGVTGFIALNSGSSANVPAMPTVWVLLLAVTALGVGGWMVRRG